VLEEEFGEIKEPKFLQQTLLLMWIVIGFIVFYVDLRKYLLNLQKRREGVRYY
jgi:flagellar biosynthesis/type III secretory pathway M-ring protein FliF/YscJ